MKFSKNIFQSLSHPLTLLIIGALISSYLIPSFTRKWQDHQRELEIKTGLVSDISENVTTFLMAIQFAEVGARSQTQEMFDSAYRNWEINSAVFRSRLQAYFPTKNIGRNWNKFSELVSIFYALTGTTDQVWRKKHLATFQKVLAKNNPEAVDWNLLAQGPRKKMQSIDDRIRYSENWVNLRNLLSDRKDEII